MVVLPGEMMVALCAAGQWLIMVAAGVFLDSRPQMVTGETSPRGRRRRAWKTEMAGLAAASGTLIALAALDGSEWAAEGMTRSWACLVPASVWVSFVVSGVLYRNLSRLVTSGADSRRKVLAGAWVLLVVFAPAFAFLAGRRVLGLDSRLSSVGGFWVVGASLGVIWAGRDHLRRRCSGLTRPARSGSMKGSDCDAD